MGLFDLFVNNNNKPVKTSGVSYVVAAQRQVSTPSTASAPAPSPQVQQAITNTAVQVGQNYPYVENSGGGGEGGSSGDGGGGANGGSDSGSSGNTMSAEEQAEQAKKAAQEKARKKALASIAHMKDSNISFKNKFDYSDIWNQVATEEQKDYWNLKEEIFLYTFHDKKQHRYLNSISIDSDKSEIMGTSQVTFPFDKKLMDYWIPGKTTFAICGGTFDREILFIGRVSEINQRGDQLEMVGQNIGWKFKSYMTQNFEDSIIGMSVKDAIKYTFKQLGFDKGRYHIDLSGIPKLDKYVVGEGCTIEKDGEQIENVPELKDVVANLKSFNIDKYISKQSKTRDVQKSADDYDKKIKMTSLSQVIDANESYHPSSLRQIYGMKTSITKNDEVLYEPVMEKIQGKQNLKDYLVKGYSGGGENTYEDLMYNIAGAIDGHFFIIDTTVCFMSFNALIANSSKVHKAIMPKIDGWQLEEDTFDLNVNQYGYYNTVIVKYKNGTVKRSYEDLVKIYGEIKITYKEPKLDYEGAMLKAQAYLMAHIRDFGMELKATVLHTGKLYPCNFVKMKNPLTMSEALFFIHGVSVQWSADNQTLVSDLDLRFGPENPDGLEVPEAGTSYSNGSGGGGGGSYSGTSASGNVSANVSQAAKEITKGCSTEEDKAYAIYDWVDKNVKYDFYYGRGSSSSELLQKKMGNCYDQAYLIYDLCSALNVKCEVHSGSFQFLDGTYDHLWNKLPYKGQMTFADTGYGTTGSLVRNPIGSLHGGKILSDNLAAKNY